MKTTIHLKSNVLITENEGLLFVLDRDNGRVHELNTTAKVIFQLCLKPTHRDDIVAEYAKYFALPTEQAVEDVDTMLELFAENDLLNA